MHKLNPKKKAVHGGYAFSHQEGFGALITTGHIFGMNKDSVEGEHQRRYSRFHTQSSFNIASYDRSQSPVGDGLSDSAVKVSVTVEEEDGEDVLIGERIDDGRILEDGGSEESSS